MKAKCDCAYHALRKARSQMCGYNRNNEMESQRKLGQNVRSNKVYIKTIFYSEPLERFLKRSE